MSHDVSTGVVEMVLDHFTAESEGTYAIQMQDGKAKGQSSLVLIGDGEGPQLMDCHAPPRCLTCFDKAPLSPGSFQGGPGRG